jgi:hypothetical protein
MSPVHHAKILTHSYEENLGPGKPRAARPKKSPLLVSTGTIQMRVGEVKDKLAEAHIVRIQWYNSKATPARSNYGDCYLALDQNEAT